MAFRVEPSRPGANREMVDRIRRLEGWHFWYAGRRDIVSRMLRAATGGRSADVLELASGTGSLSRWMSEQEHRVTGVDQVTGKCAQTGAGGRTLRFVGADGLKLPFRPGAFDLAVALDFLEHVDDLLALDEIRRILKPDGRLLLSVPAFDLLWSRRDEEAGHRRRYSMRGAAALLNKNGFEVRQLKYYQFALFPAAAASRILDRRRSDWREREERPHPAVNRILEHVNRFEASFQDSIGWPWGTSLVALAGKR